MDKVAMTLIVVFCSGITLNQKNNITFISVALSSLQKYLVLHMDK